MVQVPVGMQEPDGASQKVPAPQSAVETQSSRSWQKPTWLQNWDCPQEESLSHEQAPVDGSQENPAAHCTAAVQRLVPLFLHPARPRAAMARAATSGAIRPGAALRLARCRDVRIRAAP